MSWSIGLNRLIESLLIKKVIYSYNVNINNDINIFLKNYSNNAVGWLYFETLWTPLNEVPIPVDLASLCKVLTRAQFLAHYITRHMHSFNFAFIFYTTVLDITFWTWWLSATHILHASTVYDTLILELVQQIITMNHFNPGGFQMPNSLITQTILYRLFKNQRDKHSFIECKNGTAMR